MPEHSNDHVGELVGSYRLLRLLGKGGYADVYLGEHRYNHTLVAIKLFHRNTSEIDLEEVLNEAHTVAQLNHPHIIHVFECSVDNDYPFLVMSYASNGTLRQRHPRGSRLSCSLVVSYVQQVAEALQYAHEQKLVHRDVKPENMLIDEQEKILLSDFGLVTFSRSTSVQITGDVRGTVAYMAPEQLHGKPRTASDQYALGVVVYEWLCGRRPFKGSFAEIASQHILATPPSLCSQVPQLPPAVEQVVFTALAKHPADRFKNVTAFAHALDQASLSSISTPLSSTSARLPTTRTLIAPTDNDSPLPEEDASNPLLSSPAHKASTNRQLEELPTRHDIPDLWSYEDSPAAPASTALDEQPTHLDARPTVTKETNKDLSPVSLPTPTHKKMLKIAAILLALLLLIGGSLALTNSLFAPPQSFRKQPGISSGVATAIVSTATPAKSVNVARHDTSTRTATTPTAQSTSTHTSLPTPSATAAPKPRPTRTPTPSSIINHPLKPLPTIIGGLLP